MKNTLKKAFQNGMLHRISFIIGFVFLFGFFFVFLLLPSIESFLYTYKGIDIDFYRYHIPDFGAACLAFAVIALLLSHFLPSKKHRLPHSAVPNGSDRYLDQETDEFSDEEREALLQESWMATAERFNRNRRV